LSSFSRSGQTLLDPLECDNEVWSVSVDSAGRFIAAGTASKNPSDGTLLCYLKTGRRLLRQELGAPVWAVSLSPSGNILAATTWRGELLAFQRRGQTFQLLLRESLQEAISGCYGVRAFDDGIIAAGIYDVGIVTIDTASRDRRLYPLPTGIYNLAGSESSQSLMAGTREGSVAVFNRSGISLVHERDISVSDRPICGVATDATGSVIFAGSFDGVVSCLTRQGDFIWQIDCGGEVWSVDCNLDATVLAVGSGDGNCYVIEHSCSAGALQELMTDSASSVDWNDSGISLGLSCGATSFVLDRLESAASTNLGSSQNIEDVLHRLLRLAPTEVTDDVVLRAAQLYSTLGLHERSIELCQSLAASPELQSSALKLAGDGFRALGFSSAAQSSYRRATEGLVTTQGARLLYDLAWSYEERGQVLEAIKHYEFLLSWDITHRDALKRIEVLRRADPERGFFEENLDYTMITVSMLGPDVPKDNETDSSLSPILTARLAELSLPPEERTVLFEALDQLDQLKVFSESDLPPLAYDLAAYTKYEYAPPEDTVKKHLEMTSVVVALAGREIRRSLDIGTATCRYPQFLGRLGVPETFGIDISRHGFDHMRSRGMTFDRFIQGNGLQLPLPDNSVEVVTCMMGTLNHIPADNRASLLAEAHRVLQQGGLLLCGIWDTDCPYQSFLTMYNEVEKEGFRARPFNAEGFHLAASEGGFSATAMQRFCCFPDQFVYDLKLDTLNLDAIQRLCDIDLAVRSRVPSAPSQMFLGIGYKS